MAAILEDRENLEMSYCAKDLPIAFSRFQWSFFHHEQTKGKQICFIFPYILVIASFSPVLVFLRVQKFALQMMPSSGTVVLVLL